jgi:DNA-binding NtrC family response regulator
MAFERVGSSLTVKVDVRILAATHQDLEALIRSGRFREDLYYRLNVISVQTPPLRERKEDIFELAVSFLAQHAQGVNKPVTHLDDDAVEALTAYDWPGNIRELENTIERAVVLADGPAVTRDDLPAEVRQPSRRKLRRSMPLGTSVVRARSSKRSVAVSSLPSNRADSAPPIEDDWNAEAMAFERQRLLDALSEANSNKSEAARLLGMPRSTFCSKLQKHGLAAGP